MEVKVIALKKFYIQVLSVDLAAISGQHVK